VNYLFVRRIKGPVFLLTFGLTAMLAQWHILGFGRSWPLYLIVYGVLRLLEGAVLAASMQAPANPAGLGGPGFTSPGFTSSVSSSPAFGAPGGAPDYGTPGYTRPDYVAPAYPPVSETGLATVNPAPLQTTEEKS